MGGGGVDLRDMLECHLVLGAVVQTAKVNHLT